MLASLAAGETRIIGGLRRPATSARRSRSCAVSAPGSSRTTTASSSTAAPTARAASSVSVGSSGTTLYFMIGLASLADAPGDADRPEVLPAPPGRAAARTRSRELGVRPGVARTRRRRSPSSRRARTGGHVRICRDARRSGSPACCCWRRSPRGRPSSRSTGVLNEQPYVELTVRMMRDFGLEVGVSDDWRRFEIEPRPGARRPTEIALPPDIGSAAFGLAASALHPSDVLFRGDAHDARRRDRPPRGPLPRRRSPRWACRWSSTRRPAGCGCATTASSCAASSVDCRPMPDMLPILATLGSVRDRPDRVRERRARPPEGVRPRRLHAAAQPDGRRRRAHRATTLVIDGVRAHDRRRAVELQRPPRRRWRSPSRRRARSGASTPDLPQRLPDLLSRASSTT